MNGERSFDIPRLRRFCIRVGVLFSLIAVIIGFFHRQQFFQSYLFAFSFFIGLPLGSLGIYMIHQLTGGMWGTVIRRILEAAFRTLPVVAIFFIPLLFGIKEIYSWSHPDIVHASVALQKKEPYLNVPFFIIRVIVYFAIWFSLCRLMLRWSLREDETGAIEYHWKMEALSGPGLIIYAVTMTFAAIDWFMSLQPDWYSTIYGLLIITGQVLASFAFAVLILYFVYQEKSLSAFVDREKFHDLGNLLLTFVMLWAYLAFSQLLIIWSGDLPEEISWYLDRFHYWGWYGLFLVIFHFALPFVALLMRIVKKTPAYLVVIAVAILIGRWADMFFMIAPDFYHHFAISILDIVLPIALGGFWLYWFLGFLGSAPLLAQHDPNLKQEALVVHGASHAQA
jgi:hypothetical protein